MRGEYRGDRALVRGITVNPTTAMSRQPAVRVHWMPQPGADLQLLRPRPDLLCRRLPAAGSPP